VGVVGVGGMMYVSNQKTKAVTQQASMYRKHSSLVSPTLCAYPKLPGRSFIVTLNLALHPCTQISLRTPDGDQSGASTPLKTAEGHTSDARMNSNDVRQHISGGGKP
jgi:hypothetical protein